MKILTVIVNLNKGGTQRVAQTFAEAYSELGHDSRVLSLYGLGVRSDELGKKVTIWNTLSNNNLLEIKSWAPNIIHIHSHGPKLNDISLLLDAVTSSKVIETNVFSKPSPWADRIDVTFQLSHWAYWLFNLRGGGGYNSQIIPNPIKCKSFTKAPQREIIKFKNNYKIPLNSFVIGRIGQSFPGKWSSMLVDTFNELANDYSDIYLLVVNAPPFVLDQISQSPYKGRIVSIDQIIGDKGLSVAYSSMNTMVLTAEQGESFGVVSAESILCETPVIALATPWGDNSQCEVVGHLKGGYIVNTAKGIKEAIRLLYTKNDLLSIRDKGRKHIYDNYDYLSIAQRAIDSTSCSVKVISRSNDSIMMESLEHPAYLTRLLIKSNIAKLRTLTLYTSGYKNWLHLMQRLLNKFKNK